MITICDTKNCPHELVCFRKHKKSTDLHPGFEFTYEVKKGRFHCLNERIDVGDYDG